MDLCWNCDLPLPSVTLSAPTVIPNAIAKFCQNKKMTGKSTPSPYSKNHDGSKVQDAPLDDDSPAPPGSAEYFQVVTRTFGHHSRDVDYALHEAVTSIAHTQAAPTINKPCLASPPIRTLTSQPLYYFRGFRYDHNDTH